MPPTGSTFTDWQQVEQDSRLFDRRRLRLVGAAAAGADGRASRSCDDAAASRHEPEPCRLLEQPYERGETPSSSTQLGPADEDTTSTS